MLTMRRPSMRVSRKRAWLSASSPARVVETTSMGERERMATPL
jgi:hypothetical protein